VCVSVLVLNEGKAGGMFVYVKKEGCQLLFSSLLPLCLHKPQDSDHPHCCATSPSSLLAYAKVAVCVCGGAWAETCARKGRREIFYSVLGFQNVRVCVCVCVSG
jgi:hypothetical protein